MKKEKKVKITGVAYDAKGGAVIIAQKTEQVIYINGLDSWDPKLLGKKITVEGYMRTQKYLPEAEFNEVTGEISQGVPKGQKDDVLYEMKIVKKSK